MQGLSAQQVGISIAIIVALVVLLYDFCANLYGFIKWTIMGWNPRRFANHLVLHIIIWCLALINIVIGG